MDAAFRSLIAAAAALGLSLTPSAAAADSPPIAPLEQVQALVQPGVVYEQVTWTGYVYDETNEGYFTGDPFVASFQCTGFVVDPDGYIATAGHCVDYDAAVRDAILDQVVEWAYTNDYYQVSPNRKTIATFKQNWRIDGIADEGKPDLEVAVAYGVAVSGEPTGKALPARVVQIRPADEGDVALLKIEAKNLTVLPLSDNENTGVGTEVVSVGYPVSVDLVTDASFNPSFKEGAISAEKTTAGGLLPVYEISAAVSGGMSGGPTVGLEGDVIGLNSFSIQGETQPFNFVQPSATVEELMRSEGIENSLGEVTEQYRAGLAAYFAGDREAAITALDDVLRIVPSHQLAQEYRQKAEELPASGSLFGSWWVWLLVLGVLVLIGAVVLVVVLRARGEPPTPVEEEAAEASSASTAEAAAEPTTEALSEQPPSQEEDIFCPHCGRRHETDDLFCAHCGHRLG